MEPRRTRLLDADRFALSRIVRAHFDALQREGEGLDDGEFVPYPADGGHEGGWLIFPLSFEGHGDAAQLGVDLARNRARCPATARLFDAFGRQLAYGYSRLLPGAHVFAHRDGQREGVLRLHLPFTVPAGCRFRMGTEFIDWQPAVPVVFDGLVEHEVVNLGAERRTVLLVDFMTTPAERAYLAEVRASNGMTAT